MITWYTLFPNGWFMTLFYPLYMKYSDTGCIWCWVVLKCFNHSLYRSQQAPYVYDFLSPMTVICLFCEGGRKQRSNWLIIELLTYRGCGPYQMNLPLTSLPLPFWKTGCLCLTLWSGGCGGFSRFWPLQNYLQERKICWLHSKRIKEVSSNGPYSCEKSEVESISTKSRRD